MPEHSRTVIRLKCPKDCLNLDGNIFRNFFDHSEKKFAPKSLF